jgi:hypothetical protein
VTSNLAAVFALGEQRSKQLDLQKNIKKAQQRNLGDITWSPRRYTIK